MNENDFIGIIPTELAAMRQLERL